MSLFDHIDIRAIMGDPLSTIPTSGGLSGPKSAPDLLGKVPVLTPDMMPKKPGLFSGWGQVGEGGLTKWDRLGLIGAAMRDDHDAEALIQSQAAGRRASQPRAAALQGPPPAPGAGTNWLPPSSGMSDPTARGLAYYPGHAAAPAFDVPMGGWNGADPKMSGQLDALLNALNTMASQSGARR